MDGGSWESLELLAIIYRAPSPNSITIFSDSQKRIYNFTRRHPFEFFLSFRKRVVDALHFGIFFI